MYRIALIETDACDHLTPPPDNLALRRWVPSVWIAEKDGRYYYDTAEDGLTAVRWSFQEIEDEEVLFHLFTDMLSYESWLWIDADGDHINNFEVTWHE